jgi:hypothetical protein
VQTKADASCMQRLPQQNLRRRVSLLPTGKVSAFRGADPPLGHTSRLDGGVQGCAAAGQPRPPDNGAIRVEMPLD